MNNDEVNRLNDEVRALMYAERIAVLEPIGDSEEGLAATIAEWQSVLAEVNRERVMLIARCERAERERDRLRRALNAAIAVWCPKDPGGDGADGETWALCMAALANGAP